MKIILLVPILMFIINTYSYSDETNVESSYLMKEYSVQFGISGLLDLSPYQGRAVFYGKKMIDSNSSIRLGLTTLFTSSEENRDDSRTNNSSATSSVTINNYNNFSTIISLDYLYYINPTDLIKVYIGIGPFFNIGISSLNGSVIS